MSEKGPSPMVVRIWRTALISTVLTLLLTSAHHLLGGLIYATDWRIHGAALGLAAVPLVAVAYRRRNQPAWARVFGLLSGLLAGLAIGLFEGGYNHVLKDTLHAVNYDPVRLQAMFPQHPYEAPDNALFELTGVLQLPLGVVALTSALILWSSSPGTGRASAPRRQS